MVARVCSYNCNHGATRVSGLASHSARVLDASAIPRYKHSGIGSLRQPTQQGRSRVFAPIDRRFLLKSAAAFTVTLPFARPDRSRAAEAELIARRVLFDNADYGSVTVSPDGWHLSCLAPVDGVRNLFVARIDDLASARPVTRVIDRNIAAFYRWAQTNSHLISSRITRATRTGAPPASISAIVPSSHSPPRRASNPSWSRSTANLRPTCC